jgi:hypothetical protein
LLLVSLLVGLHIVEGL